MTGTTGEKSPFGRGFVAASIVIGAVLLCGLLLLVSDPAPPSTAAGTSGSGTSGSGAAGSGGATDPSGVVTAPVMDAPAVPASGEPSAAPKSSPPSRSGSCRPADGDQRVPTTAPPVDGWEVSRRVVVPRSGAYGPGAVDADGFRRCFAHSPTGALYAAYNAIAAMADQRKAVATAGKLMLPGPDTDALLRELRAETPNEHSGGTQIAGYRVLDASRDRFTVMLALPVEAEYMSATLTLAWYRGDWRLVPPAAGDPVGAPYSQHRDLDGFVAWSGV